MFSADDVALMATLTSVDLFTDAEGDELMHVIGSALSRVADAAIAFYVQSVESELAESGADAVILAQKAPGRPGRRWRSAPGWVPSSPICCGTA